MTRFGKQLIEVTHQEIFNIENAAQYFDMLIESGSRYILLIGPRGVGKTRLVRQAIKDVTKIPISYLNNGQVLEDISPYHQMADKKVHGALAQIEDSIIKASIKNNNVLVVKESHGLKRHQRFITEMQQDQIDLLVMTAPQSRLKKRLDSKFKGKLTGALIENMLTLDMEGFEWPDCNEKWRSVRYVNYYETQQELEELLKHFEENYTGV